MEAFFIHDSLKAISVSGPIDKVVQFYIGLTLFLVVFKIIQKFNILSALLSLCLAGY